VNVSSTFAAMAPITDPAALQAQLTKEQELNSELRKQLRSDKATSDKAIALLEQQISLLNMQLEESTRREKQQKDMADKVIFAFQTNTQQASDAEEIRDKVKLQVESTITEDHPKVRPLLDRLSHSTSQKI
jgi:ABC-type phosphate transport system auxiliary subunit